MTNMMIAPTPFVFTLYGDQKDTADYRCAKLIWRSSKDTTTGKSKPALHPTACIYVPHLQVSVTPVVLQSALQISFNEIVDAMLKDYAETLLLAGKNVNLVGMSFPGGPQAFTADAVASYFSEKEATKKLSKLVIEDFFDKEVEKRLRTKLLEQNGGNIPGDVLSRVLAEHRAALASVTSYKTFKPVPQLIKQLLATVRIADAESVVREALIAKLTPYLTPKEEISALSLGLMDE